MKIQESAENYLETIYILHKKTGSVRSIDVVNHLGFSKPSVSNAMKQFRENRKAVEKYLKENHSFFPEGGGNIDSLADYKRCSRILLLYSARKGEKGKVDV